MSRRLEAYDHEIARVLNDPSRDHSIEYLLPISMDDSETKDKKKFLSNVESILKYNDHVNRKQYIENFIHTPTYLKVADRHYIACVATLFRYALVIPQFAKMFGVRDRNSTNEALKSTYISLVQDMFSYDGLIPLEKEEKTELFKDVIEAISEPKEEKRRLRFW